jgi:hypothetical protein
MTSTRRVGVPGIALTLAGAILVLVSFTALDWYAGSGGADALQGIGFTDLHRNLTALPASAATDAYFGWVAWTLLLALIIVGSLANLPGRSSKGLRLVGLLLGLVGAAFTYYALAQYVQALHDVGAPRAGVFHQARAGIWLALLGYLAAGLGAVTGPLRRRASDTIRP